VKTVVVLQSNYIPWKGYFDLIHDADLFIFHDDVQYTKNDWRNRNKIKTPKGAEWITIPVGTNERRLICEVTITDPGWQAKHWRVITQHYAASPYFARYRPFFEEVYRGRTWTSLSDLNQFLIRSIARDILHIDTLFADSREYALSSRKLERLLELVTKAGAQRYLSGPTCRDYIDPARFAQAGVVLAWKDYSGYPEYLQRYPPFEHSVSILDLIFNVGPHASSYIWSWRTGGSTTPWRRPSVSSRSDTQ
jgi:hypothetical protein